ncbi:MAG TPA: lipopolysaccharide kinase InaA family protein [Humisphaera sp.]|nr:lipopolysaccharide kinase InaA family protein [Humisphaera sp.]
MAGAGLEQALRDLPGIGTLIKDRGYRQVWRFDFAGRAYYLKFYRRGGYRDRFRRLFRGSPAMTEFTKLQGLQKAAIPSPRAVAVMLGFRLRNEIGDAVIIEAIEPAIQLDHYCHELELRGEPIPDHLQLATKIRELVQQLAKAGFGHDDLHLGNLLLREDKLYLLDGYAVDLRGLKLRHLYQLAHSVGRFATRTDLLRGWRQIGPGGKMPVNNPVTRELADGFVGSRITGENRYFGRIRIDGWQGAYFKHQKYPRRWSVASQLQVEQADWEKILPDLLRQIEQDQLKVIKRSKSGDVLTTMIELGGRSLDVVIKRPRKRYWYRYFNEIGRGSRARRAWIKAWRLLLRNLPTALPLIFLERRSLGYVTDSLIIFERVPGPTLSRVDLASLATDQRDMLLRRAGRILRTIEREGFAHFDAKASNWIVRDDPMLGPSPILIDVDGIRRRRWLMLGIHRLLKSMRDNKHYTPADSYSLCKGYAPTAPLALEPPGGEGDLEAADLESAPTHPEDQAADADAPVGVPPNQSDSSIQ